MPGNNCFGIKSNAHGSGVQYKLTKEFVDGTWQTMKLAFNTYLTLTDCFTDHANLIVEGKPYQKCWQAYLGNKDLDSLITCVGARYGTDPGYASKILVEAHSVSLQEALAEARALLPPPNLAA